MKERIKSFLKDESGYTVQTLITTIVLGLGAAAIAFAILASNRGQGGNVSTDIKAIEVPGSAPDAGEEMSPGGAGETGAATKLED